MIGWKDRGKDRKINEIDGQKDRLIGQRLRYRQIDIRTEEQKT
jgi:hypothetical protein